MTDARVINRDEFVHANCAQFEQVPPGVFESQMAPSVISAVSEVIGTLGGEIPTGPDGIAGIPDPLKKVQALNAFLFNLLSDGKPVLSEDEYEEKRLRFPSLPPFGELYEAAKSKLDLPSDEEAAESKKMGDGPRLFIKVDEFVHANCAPFKQVPPEVFESQIAPSVIGSISEVIATLGGEIPTGPDGITDIQDPLKKIQALNALLFNLFSDGKPVLSEKEYEERRLKSVPSLPPFGELYEAAKSKLDLASDEEDH